MPYYLQVLVPSASPSFKNTMAIVHQVPEGHVGVYWRGGALLKTITEPGRKPFFVFSMLFFNVCTHRILVHV